MLKKIWQAIVNFFSKPWIKKILSFLLDRTKEILIKIGKENYDLIKAKVYEVAQENISGAAKFKKVFKYAKSLLPNVPESFLNYVIELLVQELKVSEGK